MQNRHFFFLQETAYNILSGLFNISRKKLLSLVKKCEKNSDAGVGVSRITYEIMHAKRVGKEEI